MSTQEYDVQNLNCANCSTKIEAAIQSLPEVSEANLDFINRKLTIKYHSVVDDPLRRLNKIAASFEPGVVISEKSAVAPTANISRHWIPIGLGTLLIAAAQFLSPTLRIGLSLLAYLLVANRVLLGAGKALISKQVFSEQLLMSLATVGALILGEFLEAGAVMVLYEIGLALEDHAVNKSRRAVTGLLAVKPEIAHRKGPEGVDDLGLKEISKGDTILVYPGERIPLDGIIRKGESTVDSSSLTGESEPLYVSPGIEIYAGFLNNSGLLELEVTNGEAESTVSRILNLIDNAGARKSPQEKFITRFARIYTPAVVLAAFLVFLIPTLLGFPAAVWFRRALVFLIVSCPCALVISIPLSYYVGIGVAARKGIIFKGSAYLDVLRKVKTVVFDKTGTLTTGELRIEQVFTPAGGDPDALLETLYRCEYTSSHPFAKAIKAHFTGDYDSRLVNAYSEYPGKGVLLEYGGNRLFAGSEAFLGEFGYVGFLRPEAASLVHAVKNDVYLGCVSFTDSLKPGIAKAIASLRTQGVARTVMFSGDRKSKAEKISRELGLDDFAADLLPENKLDRLEELLKTGEGKTAFVGDGMNDAPSLARADVGIAMGGIGNQASVENADVVLLNDRPEQLAGAFAIARQTGRLVTQNVALALGIKALVMALGIGGISGLWEAVIADVGVTLLVVFNSLRLLRGQSQS